MYRDISFPGGATATKVQPYINTSQELDMCAEISFAGRAATNAAHSMLYINLNGKWLVNK